MGSEIIKDDLGEHEIIKQKNGITIKLLKKPSKEYKKKIEKRNEVYKKNKEESRKKRDIEKLIKDKMRELAIKELKKEGKI